jgi:hypothetical protein
VSTPDPRLFTPAERDALAFVRWTLRASSRLFFSEWAVRTPDRRRLAVAPDPRIGPPNVPDAAVVR